MKRHVSDRQGCETGMPGMGHNPKCLCEHNESASAPTADIDRTIRTDRFAPRHKVAALQPAARGA